MVQTILEHAKGQATIAAKPVENAIASSTAASSTA